MPSIPATARYDRALHAIAELLGKLRLDYVFVGDVARAAWLGGDVSNGSIDALAVLTAEQKNQVAMMGSNRGFRVDREAIEASEELDLIPLNFLDEEGEIRVHVLVASNALYGRMVAAGREATLSSERIVRVAAPEDLALMLTIAEDEVTVRRLATLDGFDRRAYNERLVTIGLPGLVLAE
jgi:hypothetical protein